MVEKRVTGGPKRVLWLTLALVLGAVLIIAAFVYRGRLANEAERNSQIQDKSLCFVLNESRKATRVNSLAIYQLVSGVLKAGGPDDSELERTFRKQERILAAQLKALRPINCETYVRPELPLPAAGVPSG